MSIRRTQTLKEAFPVPTAAQGGLSISYAERTALTLPWPTPAAPIDAPEGGGGGDMYGNRTTVRARKIMMLKGLVFGIPGAKYNEAFQTAMATIEENKITTICWDGDKYTYAHPDTGAPRAQGFTLLLEMLHEAKPGLEFIFFKRLGVEKELAAGGLVTGFKPACLRDMDIHGNVLGPFPMLTMKNTTILSEDDPPLSSVPGKHYGIEFKGNMEWYELGLKGLMYIKNTLGIASVTYMVFGLGGAVAKELKEVAKDPSKYPAGLAKDEVKIVEVVR